MVRPCALHSMTVRSKLMAPWLAEWLAPHGMVALSKELEFLNSNLADLAEECHGVHAS